MFTCICMYVYIYFDENETVFDENLSKVVSFCNSWEARRKQHRYSSTFLFTFVWRLSLYDTIRARYVAINLSERDKTLFVQRFRTREETSGTQSATIKQHCYLLFWTFLYAQTSGWFCIMSLPISRVQLFLLRATIFTIIFYSLKA